MFQAASIAHRRALLLLLLTAALWSLGGVLIKSISLHPLAIAGLRSAVAAVVLAIVARRFKFTWTRAQFSSMFFFAGTVILFVTATKLTTAANAILLQYTAPIYVAFLSWPILGERVSKRDIKALTIVFAGMVIFFLEKISTAHTFGNICALASGVCFAGLAICLKKQNGESTLESLFLGHALTTLIGTPFLLAGAMPSWRDAGLIAILGVVQLGIPYVLYGIAIRYVTALEASLVPVLEPILNPIWVLLATGEEPSAHALVGGGLVLTAVLWHTFDSARSNVKAKRLA